MNSKMIKYTMAAAILFSTAEAVTLSNAGIFDKVFKEEADAAALAQEKSEAIEYKKKQLAEAELEHEKAVKEEEEEDRKKEEAEQKSWEERQLMQRQADADKRKAQMMAEIDRENVAIRSQVRLAQVSSSDNGELVLGEGLQFTNNSQQQEKVAEPITSIIGSGPDQSGISHL